MDTVGSSGIENKANRLTLSCVASVVNPLFDVRYRPRSLSLSLAHSLSLVMVSSIGLLLVMQLRCAHFNRIRVPRITGTGTKPPKIGFWLSTGRTLWRGTTLSVGKVNPLRVPKLILHSLFALFLASLPLAPALVVLYIETAMGRSSSARMDWTFSTMRGPHRLSPSFVLG